MACCSLSDREPPPAKGARRPLGHSPVQTGSWDCRATPAPLSFARRTSVSASTDSALFQGRHRTLPLERPAVPAVVAGVEEIVVVSPEDSTGRMSTLISDLLQFSRITTRGEPFEKIDLNQVIDGVLSDLRERIRNTRWPPPAATPRS